MNTLQFQRLFIVATIAFLAGLATGFVCGYMLGFGVAKDECFTDSCVGCTDDCLGEKDDERS